MERASVPGAVPAESPERRLERWMSQYGNAVLHTGFVCLSDVQLAEDAMQDTFVKAWRAMGAFEKRTGFSERAWLMRIAINTCRDYRRGMWFQRVDLPGEMEKLPPAMISVSPREREIFLDVLSMPEKYRQMILFRYYENMTLREMADILGLSISSVHHRLKKAEALMRLDFEGRDIIEAQ